MQALIVYRLKTGALVLLPTESPRHTAGRLEAKGYKFTIVDRRNLEFIQSMEYARFGLAEELVVKAKDPRLTETVNQGRS